MEFITAAHKERYQEFIEKAKCSNDSERKALFYIISSNEDLSRKVSYIYDFHEKAIIPDCFEKADFCSSSKALLKLAFNLYNSFNKCNICDCLSMQDEDNFEVAVNALKLRFGRI